MYLNKLPATLTADDRVLVTDPMLATGMPRRPAACLSTASVLTPLDCTRSFAALVAVWTSGCKCNVREQLPSNASSLPAALLACLAQLLRAATASFAVHRVSDAGGTITAVLDDIIARGAVASNIRVIAVVAAPPALKRLADKYPGAFLCRSCVIAGAFAILPHCRVLH
jgi:hypothetical protein